MTVFCIFDHCSLYCFFKVKYEVTLTKGEREELEAIISKGKHTSLKCSNAYILLNVDDGEHNDERLVNKEIQRVLKVGERTIDRVKKRFVEKGFEKVLEKKPTNRTYKRIVDGDAEAHLISLCCGNPPEGYGRWTLRLLADKMVELEYIDDISHEEVRQVLKKNELKPWQVQEWVIPPKANSDFVADME